MSVYQPDDGITVDIPELLKSRDLILRDLCESFLYFSCSYLEFHSKITDVPGWQSQLKKTGLSWYPTKRNLCNHPYSFPSASNSSASSSSASSPTTASSSQQPQSQSLMLVFL